MLSRTRTRNNQAMPELPDLRVLEEAFTATLVGRELRAVQLRRPLVLRGTAAELRALTGQRLLGVSQRGKFLTFQLSRDRLVVNAMLTGRLGLAEPAARPWAQEALGLTFGPRAAPPEALPQVSWTSGAGWLPAETEPIDLRYRDPRTMGKVYLVPEGIARDVAGWLELGPDADDPGLDLATWNARIGRHPGELMSLLKNQRFVAGIGNAYSDEILWAARLEPFRRRSTLAPEESERLWRATREILAWAIDELRQRVPPRFEVQARDFLRVHRRGGQACPRCGTTLSEVSPGGFVTTWCRACQA